MNMPVACKVCESDKKDSIEEMILQGHSNLHIANELKDMGIDISHASINRHKNTHMKEHEEKIKELASSKCNTKYDRNDNLGEINASEIYDEIKQQTLHGISYDELAKNNIINKLMLDRISNNQLAITIDLQEKYMKGACKYPHEQIRGLQIIQDMAQKFEVYTRKNFSHYKAIANSGSGVRQHVLEHGKNAKKELALIKPYEKGMLFIIMTNSDFEEYEKEYHPVNPYQKSSFSCETDYNWFEEGIKLAYSQDESIDVQLFRTIEEVIKDYELLPNDEYEKLIKRYSYGKYNAIRELAKYKKMLDDYENQPDENVNI